MPNSLFYPALGFDSAYLMMKELGAKVDGKLLLGVDSKNEYGIYDVPSVVLKIHGGKIVKK